MMKLFITVISLSIFDVALMDDAEADQFLLRVGIRRASFEFLTRPDSPGDQPLYQQGVAEVINKFKNGKFVHDVAFKLHVFDQCLIHYRNLMLKQLLQMKSQPGPGPWTDDAKRYLGCVATRSNREQFPSINYAPVDGYSYFPPQQFPYTLLQSFGALIGELTTPDQATFNKFAISYRIPQNGPAVVRICRQVRDIGVTTDQPMIFCQKACTFIRILLNGITVYQRNQI